MGKFSSTIAPTTDKQLPARRRKGSSDTPSANALRERVRAQNMKRAYLKLQKTLPQVPPDTKLPRLNILLLAIDYISHLRDVLHNGTCAAEENPLPHKVEDKCGMFRPFIEKWPIRCQLLSEFLRPQLDETQTKQQITLKEKWTDWNMVLRCSKVPPSTKLLVVLSYSWARALAQLFSTFMTQAFYLNMKAE